MTRLGQLIRHLHDAARSFSPPDGLPYAFIDWETAGPVDPLYDLAQACWLNAQLHDEEVTERVGLPSLEIRAEQARQILDGYELPTVAREGFVDRMIEFAVHDAAAQVPDVTIAPDTHDAKDLWALTWRVRSAGWMLRHRQALQRALV